MKSHSHLVLVSLGGLALVSCAFLGMRKPHEPQKQSHQPTLVGRIASIPPDRGFVLIQSYGKWEVASGSVLVSRGPGNRTANLLTTGESLGQFAAADLQSGTLDVGDAVFLLSPITQKKSPEIQKNSEIPKNTPTIENIKQTKPIESQ